MIRIAVYKDRTGYTGFVSKGHADYAEAGTDIICAAVSVLLINTVNSIEAFTSDHFQVKQQSGYLSCKFQNTLSDEGRLLMDSMVLGIKQIRKEYGSQYIKLIIKEV